MKETHFIPYGVRITKFVVMHAVCGKYVHYDEIAMHGDPTCPVCKRIVNEEDAGE